MRLPIIPMVLAASLLTSCQYLKTEDQLVRGAAQYQLYEFNAYECHECKRKRLIAELTSKKSEEIFEQ